MAVPDLPTDLDLKVFDGFGRAVRAPCYAASPRSEAELVELLAFARQHGLSVGFRGAGRSYGDAALNREGLVLDMRGLGGMLHWDAEQGIAEARGGLTIGGLWRRTLQDGYWPAVVPGTMAPTLAGCLSTNVHGKNNFAVGPIGDHVQDFDLITAQGEKLLCSREKNPNFFWAAIGGLGLLGAITRVRLKLKKVESGNLRVRPFAARSLTEAFDVFEEQLPSADYLVSWVDCTSTGGAAGRSIIHKANYLREDEDPMGAASLQVERQGLPMRIFGIPRSSLWRLMVPWMNNPGMRLMNLGKYLVGRFGPQGEYFQSHVAFAFLLDYVPNWRLAYGAEGFIQVQLFVPREAARETFQDVLQLARDRRLPPYLGVMKRHRPDDFVLTHAVDGYSLAMDYRVTETNREALWSLVHDLHERALAAGGRFYMAKDAVLRPEDYRRSLGSERLQRFMAVKKTLDPEGMFSSDLGRRVLPLTPPPSKPQARSGTPELASLPLQSAGA